MKTEVKPNHWQWRITYPHRGSTCQGNYDTCNGATASVFRAAANALVDHESVEVEVFEMCGTCQGESRIVSRSNKMGHPVAWKICPCCNGKDGPLQTIAFEATLPSGIQVIDRVIEDSLVTA